MVKGVSNVWLPVNDMERALQFYGDTLGLSLKENHGEWAELEVDGLTVGLNARDSEQPGSEGGAVLAFQATKGLEETVEELQGKGVEVVDGITDHPWGRIAAFKDPDGNSLEFFEPPKS
jgi:predicted enzyme related to lactoylglutathione lyase